MRKILILWLLPFVLCIDLYGQFKEGYLVKSDGDSISGFVSFNEYRNPREVEFKSGKGSKKVVYTPDQVKVFGLSYSTRVASLVVPVADGATQHLFVRQLVGGRMDLFVSKDRFFIRENGEVYELLSSRNKSSAGEKYRGYYKDVLEKFFEGCISAENASYEETSLRNLINNYNRCHRVQPLVYRDLSRGSTLALSVIVGADKSDMKVNDKVPMPTTFHPSIGIGTILNTQGLQNRLFLDLQMHFSSRKGEIFMREPINRERNVYSTYELEFNMIRVPFGVGYYITEPARTPVYVKAGVSKAFILSSTFSYVRENEGYTLVTTESATHRNVIGTKVGLWASVGVRARVFKDQKAFLEIRGERISPVVDVPMRAISLKMTNVGIYAGFVF
mgnify:CR=1 FL=1|jgi:hypothetical protein